MIPMIDLQAQRARIGDRIDAAVARVLAGGAYILGPEVQELERQLAAFAGVRHAITCASGTDALLMPLMAWEIGPGDAVFVPTFTFVATAEVVALAGATPVFVDVQPDSFNLDPASLAAAVDMARSLGLRAAAVMPVDLFGQPADHGAVGAVARTHGLKVLTDAAQSFGAMSQGRRAGSRGDAAGTSFYPAKPLGCYGDGGAMFTDDDDLAERLRSLRVHGAGSDRYDNVRIGMNGRMDTIQAAILLEKLRVFEDEIERRQDVAARFDQLLDGLVETPQVAPGVTSAWAQYTIRTPKRDRVAAALRDAEIACAIYYPIPLHQQTGYRHFPVAPGGAPVSEALAKDVLSLPMHPYLDEQTQAGIVAALKTGLKA